MNAIEELRERYRELIADQEEYDRGPEGAQVTTFAVDPVRPLTRTGLRTRLVELFRQQPELLTVVLTTGEVRFGIVRRETVRPDGPYVSRETLPAESMPGPPARFRARYYACVHAQCQDCAGGSCTASKILLFGDGQPPQCPHGHGPMAEEE